MFIIAQNCGSACTVIGKYTLSPISDSDDMVYMKQYCVFIWELSGLGELKLKHIGVTKPDSMSESVYGNAFNSAMIPAGSALHQQNRSSDRMIITDTDDCTRFIPRNDILYATSDTPFHLICRRTDYPLDKPDPRHQGKQTFQTPSDYKSQKFRCLRKKFLLRQIVQDFHQKCDLDQRNDPFQNHKFHKKNQEKRQIIKCDRRNTSHGDCHTDKVDRTDNYCRNG